MEAGFSFSIEKILKAVGAVLSSMFSLRKTTPKDRSDCFPAATDQPSAAVRYPSTTIGYPPIACNGHQTFCFFLLSVFWFENTAESGNVYASLILIS